MKRENIFVDDLSLPNDLCVAPLKIAKSDDTHKTFERRQVNTEFQFKDMIIKNADYQTQYAPLYFNRLQTMRPWVLEKIKQQDKSSLPIRGKLIEVKLKEECWVVGTLYREIKDRPTALDEYDDVKRIQKIKKDSYAGPNDKFVVEDETGRATLSGIQKFEESLCTGLIVGLRCWEKENGELEVLQILTPGFADQKNQPKTEETGLVAFVCGLKKKKEKYFKLIFF